MGYQSLSSPIAVQSSCPNSGKLSAHHAISTTDSPLLFTHKQTVKQNVSMLSWNSTCGATSTTYRMTGKNGWHWQNSLATITLRNQQAYLPSSQTTASTQFGTLTPSTPHEPVPSKINIMRQKYRSISK